MKILSLLSRAAIFGGGAGYTVIPFNVFLGTIYPCDTVTDNGGGSFNMTSSDNGGGGVYGSQNSGVVFTLGNTYVVRYKITGTSTTAIRIRGSNSTSGNGSFGNLNITNATIDGAWHEVEFTAAGNDDYLQVGASTTGNFDIDVEIEIREMP